ncbi:MAG: hypothetical protein EXR69_16735 [Myxococcales bacterium]|nr:hypothetical protein [Myxococcales bacterium]
MRRSPAHRAFLSAALLVGCSVGCSVGCNGLDVVPIFTTDTCEHNGLDVASREVTVAYPLDGDTFETTEGETVRLLGVDAPEIEHPTIAEECWGPQSADWLAAELTGQRVQLAFDKECVDTYGRTLAYVRVSSSGAGTVVDTGDTADTGQASGSIEFDLLINEQSVRLGQSTVYEDFDDIKLKDVLYAAQAVAQRESAGLWGVCESA